MKTSFSRRHFLATGLGTTTALAAGALSPAEATPAVDAPKSPPLRLGLMTYNLGRDWDLDTLIHNLQETRFEHAELRTTHQHGVEVGLTAEKRREVRRRFKEAGIALSLASAFAYHWPDPEELQKHIQGTKEYVLLARDIGAIGIRVFPNSIEVPGVPAGRTMEQIGRAVAEVAAFAADHGVEIRLANHGRGTHRIPVLRQILDRADSPHVFVNWNCDRTDLDAPGFEANFNSLKDRIRNIHLHDLADGVYPYRRLFELLRAANYRGYCDAEVAESAEPLVFMNYYRALFLALQNAI